MTFMDDFQKWLVLSGWFKLFLHIVYWWMDRRTDRHCYWLSCYCNWKARVQYSFLSNIFHKACTFKFSWKPCKYVKGLMVNFYHLLQILIEELEFGLIHPLVLMPMELFPLYKLLTPDSLIVYAFVLSYFMLDHFRLADMCISHVYTCLQWQCLECQFII